MKAKTFFERLYLVSGLRNIVLFVTMFSALTSPSLLLRLFLDFHAIPSGSSIFLLIRQVIWPSPGTLVPARLLGES